MDIGLIKQTINRTSRCNKVDTVGLYASKSVEFTFTKGTEDRVLAQLGKRENEFILLHIRNQNIFLLLNEKDFNQTFNLL